MIRILGTLIIILTIFGCDKQKEQVAKFIFDNSRISERIIHSYEYLHNGKIKTDKSIRYISMNGVVIDSMLTIEEYYYDNKNRLIRVNNLIDSSAQIKEYDILDSLVGNYSLNKYGDTMRLMRQSFENGKISKFRHYALFAKLQMPISQESFKTYDTVMNQSSERIVDSGSNEILVTKDSKGNLIDELHYAYDKGKLIRTISYSFLGDEKYVSRTTYFEDSFENEVPNSYSIDAKGDTISISKTIISNGNKAQITTNDYGGFQNISYYNDHGQEIGRVFYSDKSKTKTFYKYTLDKHGNILEEFSYREKLK